MRKFTTLALVASTALAIATPAASTIINLDGKTNASMTGNNAITQNFGAGTYAVSFTEDQFTAFSRWTSSAGCDAQSQNCRQGWENSAIFFFGGDAGTAVFLGDGAAHGGNGPVSGGGYFNTAAQAFAHSSMYWGTFTLTIPTDVSFFIGDNVTSDNRGGISLSVDRLAVPEPAPWPFLLAGAGLLALMLRLRKRQTGF